MDHEKKLAFLQNMTHMALSHAASTPNIPTPTGGMSHDKMMSFVNGIANKGLQHFADGGTTLGGPASNGINGQTAVGGWNGAIGNFLGTNNQFQANAAPIQQGTNTAQLNNAYTGAQGALGAQGNIAGTLNTGLNTGVNSQNLLTNMYLNQANGVGPNPALAQLNQQTGNNIAQQAALIAGQRGAGANAGLIARQNAQQGAATQQTAVGQAVTLQAQQQLAAQNNLQNLASSQVAQGTSATQGLNNATQNEQNILQGANTAENNANVSQQSNLNNVNASISTANQNNAGNIVSGVGKALSSIPIIGSLFADGGVVENKMSYTGAADNERQQRAQAAQNGFQKAANDNPISNAFDWISNKMADGGVVGQQTSGPQSYVGQWLNSSVDTQGPSQQPVASINTDIKNPFVKDKTSGGGAAPNPLEGFDPNTATQIGGSSASDLSGTGAADLSSVSGAGGAGGLESLEGVAAELGPLALAAKGGLMKKGGNVKGTLGENASVPGDSIKNDKVPAMLSEGEIVIPRHITMGPNAPAKAAMFVAKELAKRGKNK